MKFGTLFSFVAPIVSLETVKASTSAAELANSPAGLVYQADFPASGPQKSISGYVKFSSTSNGTVEVTVDLKDFPTAGGPFSYHIHVDPVPANGSCASTLAHLNPYGAPASPPNVCDSSKPETCEIGDLAGVHGKITQDPFTANYIHPYISLNEDESSAESPIGRSIVIHFKNTTRIACANIKKVSSNYTAPISNSGVKVSGSSVAIIGVLSGLVSFLF